MLSPTSSTSSSATTAASTSTQPSASSTSKSSSGKRSSNTDSAVHFIHEAKICFRTSVFIEPVFVTVDVSGGFDPVYFDPDQSCQLVYIPDLRTTFYSRRNADGDVHEYGYADSRCLIHDVSCPVTPRRRLLRLKTYNTDTNGVPVKRSKASKGAATRVVGAIDLTREEEAPAAPVQARAGPSREGQANN